MAFINLPQKDNNGSLSPTEWNYLVDKLNAMKIRDLTDVEDLDPSQYEMLRHDGSGWVLVDIRTDFYTKPQIDNMTIGAGGGGSGDMYKNIYDTNNSGKVNDSEKVNGHSVDSDVPANAKFTDTISDLDGNAKNKTTIVELDEPFGNWGDSPDSPLTNTPINISLTNALNAGTSCVYFSGKVLDKNDFNESITFFSGSNRLDVLCAVWITYDKGSGAFHVNIQDTWTGDLPTPPVGDIENAPTNLVLTLEEVAGDIENAPTNLILTEEEI